MRAKLLVHGSQARCISSPQEVERLLSMGWVLAMPAPRTPTAKRMRDLRAKRRGAGWQSLLLWLPPDQVAIVKAALRPNESYAELLTRLVQEQSLIRKKPQVDEYN